MQEKDLNLPQLWPDEFLQQQQIGSEAFRTIVSQSRGIFGSAYGLDSKSIHWLKSLFSKKDALAMRLIISLYPDIEDQQNVLDRLYDLQNEFTGRLEIHLYVQCVLSPRTSILCLAPTTDRVFCIAFGPHENFGFGRMDWINPVTLFNPEQALYKMITDWFDYAWKNTAPLDQNTAQIPAVVLPKGTPEGAFLWEQYGQLCERMIANNETADKQKDSPSEAPKEQQKKSDSIVEKMGLPVVLELDLKIEKILSKGILATLNKRTKIPPLKAPIKAKYFGLKSFRQIGSISAETRCRISILPKDAQKKIDNMMKKASELLRKLSFPFLADGVRWMPHGAVPLFNEEMQKVDSDAKEILKKQIGNNISEYITKQKDKIRNDANNMFPLLVGRKGTISEKDVDNIISDLKERFSKAMSGSFIPEITKNKVSTWVAPASNTAKYGQAVTLLQGIAEFPRKLYNLYSMQSYTVSRERLLEIMDVCDDWASKPDLPLPDAGSTMEDQLMNISKIVSSDAKDDQKCQKLFGIMKKCPDQYR